MAKAGKKPEAPVVRVDSDVVRQIRQHARSCSKAEVCGVLIGTESERGVMIEVCIAGVNAAQGGAHVTFTQDTWEHIYKIKDQDYPNDRIVGWYHSHPGFGVFLSDHDSFIHKNFFSSPQQVAWVYDPHSDEEGCFGWVGERLERLSQVSLIDSKGGEGAGETGKPEPTGYQIDEADEDTSVKRAGGADAGNSRSSVLHVVGTVCSYISVFLIGVLLAWFVFPRVLVMPVPVDPQTGQPVMMGAPAGQSAGEQNKQSEPPSQAQPGSTKGSNGKQR